MSVMSHLKLITCTSRVLTGAAVRPDYGDLLLGHLSFRNQEQVRTMSNHCKAECGKGSGGGGNVVTMENLNPNMIKLQYAVRGPIVVRSLEIEQEIAKGTKKPFDRVIKANIGDAHAMGQQPITFIRQVLACIAYPPLIKESNFPSDVKEKASAILCACGGQSAGSYSSSYGIDMIRKSVASYIERRDGHKADFNNICLCTGASTGIKNVLQMFCNTVDGKMSGVMIPIPQYPLYSASLAEFGLGQIPYYLDEANGWGLTTEELERAYDEGSKTHAVRAIVIINPGNPTGQVLKRENIEEIVKFAHKKNLFILADEVYQDNVYNPEDKFHSFKKVITDLGAPYSGMELASFMSASKGYMGECGIRGGWMEVVNLQPDVRANLYKTISAMLCPTTLGQAVMECVANPPKAGDPSYEKFEQEKNAVLSSLAKRATMIVETFNKMEGFKCNKVQGAMYAFPQITLPPKAIEAAKKANMPADTFYVFRLLEETGICIIPGSGFGQKPNTWHFRTTILPQPDLLAKMLETFQKFHAKFTKDFA